MTQEDVETIFKVVSFSSSEEVSNEYKLINFLDLIEFVTEKTVFSFFQPFSCYLYGFLTH